ncbi:hypothetical protein [Amycolatopsis nigrescens]|uniref:hypothetical protein n=1 Tax=Amycolatopsis nigrescens TaxID=381445 RepID=UPI00039CAA0E|nr:hypothetical protein [Amycolatopsis nigrescens]
MVAKTRASVLALVLGLLVVLGAPAAVAQPAAEVRQPVAAAVAPVLAQDQTPVPGPTIDPAESQRADSEETRNKIIVGVSAAVLLLLVLWGRKVRKGKKAS